MTTTRHIPKLPTLLAAATTGALALSFTLVAPAPAAAQTAPEGPSFTYSYERPAGLAERPESLRLALPRVAPAEARTAGERKASRLAAALGMKLDGGEWKADEHDELLRLATDRYRVKVYLPSGMVTIQDVERYNRPLADDERPEPLDRDRAMELAKRTVQRLAEAGLVDPEQLLWDAPRFSYRKVGMVRGARQGEKGRPRIEPARVADTRVFLSRAIGGVGVSGHGVRLVFDPEGELAAADLLWRDLEPAGEKLALRLDRAAARRVFERDAPVPDNARVDVKAEELVYFDPSMRDPVAFLEPVYLYVYEVRVPSAKEGVYRVSKLLHHTVAAVEHDRRQVPSPRQARLARLERTESRPRPLKPPPPSSGEEDDGD